jgi:hypothetical protein
MELWRGFEHTFYAERTLSTTLNGSCDRHKGGDKRVLKILRNSSISYFRCSGKREKGKGHLMTCLYRQGEAEDDEDV